MATTQNRIGQYGTPRLRIVDPRRQTSERCTSCSQPITPGGAFYYDRARVCRNCYHGLCHGWSQESAVQGRLRQQRRRDRALALALFYVGLVIAGLGVWHMLAGTT